MDLEHDINSLEERLKREPAALFLEPKNGQELMQALRTGQHALNHTDVEFVFIKRDLPQNMDFFGLAYALDNRSFSEPGGAITQLRQLQIAYQEMPRFRKEIDFILKEQYGITATVDGPQYSETLITFPVDTDWHMDAGREGFLFTGAKEVSHGTSIVTAYANGGSVFTPLSNVHKIQTTSNDQSDYLTVVPQEQHLAFAFENNLWPLEVTENGVAQDVAGRFIRGATLEDENRIFILPEGWIGMWHTAKTIHRSPTQDETGHPRLSVLRQRERVPNTVKEVEKTLGIRRR